MRHWTVALAIIATFIISGIAHAGTSDCGATKYFACSKEADYVGFRCGPSGMMKDPSCRCEDVPGYVTQGSGESATCILAKCPDGTANGQCSATKPKQCVLGVLIDNATLCNCPPDKVKSSNGLSCVGKPCNDSGTSVLDGACSTKTSGKQCKNGVLVSNVSACPCSSPTKNMNGTCLVVCGDDTPVGQCSSSQPKECILTANGVGYLQDNAPKCGCPEGKAAIGDQKQCTQTATVPISGSDSIDGDFANSTAVDGSQSPLSCCCMPAALIGIVGGFAYFRKR